MDERFSDESLCARGGWSEDFTTRPSNPPIYQTTAFDLHGVEQLEAVVSGTEQGFIYTRDGNPNHSAFAQDVAKLEHANAGAVCASGMAAVSAILLSHLKSGDHVVAARVLYGRTSQQLEELSKRFGIEVTFADSRITDEMSSAVKENTKLCLVESISNPLMEVVDLPALVDAMGNVPVVVDNTFATPCLFRPFEHGAKLVFHSASKYLNGHGDVMLGVVAGERAAVTRVRRVASLYGLNANPFECWLASRGLRTLPLRIEPVQTHSRWPSSWSNTQRSAAWFIRDSRVIRTSNWRAGCCPTAAAGCCLSSFMQKKLAYERCCENLRIPFRFRPRWQTFEQRSPGRPARLTSSWKLAIDERGASPTALCGFQSESTPCRM